MQQNSKEMDIFGEDLAAWVGVLEILPATPALHLMNLSA